MEHLLIVAMVIIVAVYVYCSHRADEQFFIPQNTVTGGDFHIQPEGAIADEGSFSDVMYNYIQGDGQI
jgi:hypothetical protein